MDFLEQSKAEARQPTLFGMIWRAVRSGVYLWWLTRKEGQAKGDRFRYARTAAKTDEPTTGQDTAPTSKN